MQNKTLKNMKLTHNEKVRPGVLRKWTSPVLHVAFIVSSPRQIQFIGMAQKPNQL